MKIVYDDIIYSLQKSGGISELWSCVTRSLSSHPITHLVYRKSISNNLFVEEKNHSYIDCSSRLLLLKRYFNVRFKSDEPFIFHSSYYRTCTNPNAINVTTVHDFMYEYFHKEWKSNLHKIQKRNAVMNSDGIICISQNTANDLRKFYPEVKGTIRVIYNGYDDTTYRFFYKERKKQLLYVGGRRHHKNFRFAAELCKHLKDYTLVIVGGGDLQADELNLLSGIRYTKKGYTSKEELADLYNSSFMLLYTSNYEGFGIPPIEAQACGCVVACQNVSSLPEVVRDTTVFIKKDDIDGSVRQILSCEDPQTYSRYQALGLDNVKRFSWEKCASEYFSFYETLFQQKKS